MGHGVVGSGVAEILLTHKQKLKLHLLKFKVMLWLNKMKIIHKI